MAVLGSRDVAAKAAYVGLPEAIERADTIAIVHTESVVVAEIRGEHWTYRQRVVATVVDTLKGAAVERIEIAADKTFICAPVPYEAPADYLVFLADDGGHLATVNNEMGQLRIVDGNVEWPYGSWSPRPLADVVDEVRAMVGEPEPIATPEPMPEVAPTPAPAEPPTQIDTDEPEPASWPAPVWIATGAFAVVLGMLAATRRRRAR